MDRTRIALIDGARRVVAERGVRKTTMAEVAVRAGVAKATVYNHLRTKDDVLVLLVSDLLERIQDACADARANSDLGAALTAAASTVALDEVLVALREREPSALLPLLDAAPWAFPATGTLLEDCGRVHDDASVDVAHRWLMSHVLTPGDGDVRAVAAQRIAQSLPLSARLTVFTHPS